METATRKQVDFLTIGMLIVLIGFGIWVVRTCDQTFGNRFDDRSFNRAEWMAAADQGSDSVRGLMADDLIHNHLPKGMTYEQVKALLGTPFSIGSPDGLGDFPENSSVKKVVTYYLGSWSGFRMDGDYLAIALDEQGKVVMAWHFQS